MSSKNGSESQSDGEFGGKIGRSYEESTEWWPEPVKPHPDAPNVLIL